MLVTVLLTVFGLEMTMVSVAVPVVPVEVTGLKDLLMVGAFGSETFCTWNEADAATVLLPAVVVKRADRDVVGVKIGDRGRYPDAERTAAPACGSARYDRAGRNDGRSCPSYAGQCAAAGRVTSAVPSL
jgi:hypothetical protein